MHPSPPSPSNSDFRWGSPTWKLHTWQKVLTVRHVHHLGFNVIQSDLDVVWFRLVCVCVWGGEREDLDVVWFRCVCLTVMDLFIPAHLATTCSLFQYIVPTVPPLPTLRDPLPYFLVDYNKADYMVSLVGVGTSAQ